jgi:cyclophilin family peptidyl-prolyl cis-trans isomerase
VPSDKRTRKREGRQLRQQAMRAAQRKASVRRRAISTVVIVGLVLAVVALVSVAQGGKEETSSSTTSSTAPSPAKAKPVPAGQAIKGDTPCPEADGSSARASSFEKPPPTCIDRGKTYTAIFDTSEGVIEVALDAKDTPGTTNNFVVLSRYHYYDGSAIHRTDPSIGIIQGGAPTAQSASDPGPGYTIPDEKCPPCSYHEGDLVMARTGEPNSAGAQFFFAADPKVSALDAQGTYVIFGHVSQGLDVVKKILGLHQADPSSGLGGYPKRVVTVEKLTIRES